MLLYGMQYGKTAKTKCTMCDREVTISTDGVSGYKYSCMCGHREELGKLYNENWDKGLLKRCI